ncbi:hypothetical protein LMG26788_03791 [Achromobacter pulmonis]|uniref:Uncharacterized protein n=1 Tax=Achromobacter pulmonis TaxID=1389932 RepID=A0A6S7DGA0_9BURK|nr:hypothetical protein [Achromobacter pulmonis]CAB3889990.1 hypothetical protein LMG26788_03725 [Achromobacter pulmonis]CAB3891325.1 hypothetical protein LMG26788_03791 [Achromobacter pulmonis]
MDENGILEHVPGQYVAQAQQTLPPAATAEDRDYTVEIDAGHAGLVRLTFRRQKARRAKHSHWFWLARRADAV